VSVRVPVLVVTAYVLLSLSWLFTNPPGSAPDETAHYVKALAAGHGRLYLPDPPPPLTSLLPSTPEAQWQQRTARLVDVPARLDPRGLQCSSFHPELSAACLLHGPAGTRAEIPTIVGTYQPYVYVLPGLLMRVGSDQLSTTRLGRVGCWAVASVMIALAVFLLWSPDDSGYSLVGLMLAVTPMVLFMSSMLSANGIEICAGVCFFASVLRLIRDDGGGGRWVWAAAGASGALLAMARITGVLWVGLAGLVVLAMVGRRQAWSIVAGGGRRAVGAAVAVGTAVVASVGWEVIVQPHPDRSISTAVRDVPTELRELTAIYRQGIGVFGWLDTNMNPAAYWLWTGLLVVVVVLALLVAHRRRRWVLCGLAVASVVVTVGLAVLNRPTGFGVQARYVLAFVVVVPLVAGETLFTNRSRLGRLEPRWLPLGVTAVVTLVQLGGWYANARRYAVGAGGPRWFFADPEWNPPLGWVPWVIVTLIGAAALIAATVLAVRGSPSAVERVDA